MRSVLLLLLVSVISTTTAGGKSRKERPPPVSGLGFSGWRYGNCVPSNGDCGPGLREGSCDQRTVKIKCKVPCERILLRFGVNCRSQFGHWGGCDQSTGSQTRVGTLKRPLNIAGCRPTASWSKPCSKQRRKPGKKKKGKGNSNPADLRNQSSESNNQTRSDRWTGSNPPRRQNLQ